MLFLDLISGQPCVPGGESNFYDWWIAEVGAGDIADAREIFNSLGGTDSEQCVACCLRICEYGDWDRDQNEVVCM